jgi:hypothetical protein
MCNPAIVVGAMAAAGATQAYGQYQEGIAANKMYQYQANQERQQGAAALARADKQSQLIQDSAKFEGKQQKIKAAETMASQRAAMTAMGMDASSVTAGDIASSSLSKSALDEMAIRYNADAKSWATTEEGKYANWTAQNQANMFSSSGKSAKKAGKMNAFGTLLGTAANIGYAGWDMGLFKSKKIG